MDALPQYKDVALCWEYPELEEKARTLAATYGFPCAEKHDAQTHLFLMVTKNRLELHANPSLLPQFSSMGPIYAEFLHGPYGYRRNHSHGRKELIIRAAGPVAKSKNKTLMDVTAGLGRDGFLLAAHGWQVTMVERSAVAAALLQDGLQRAMADLRTQHIAQKINCIHADSTELLLSLAESQYPDIIYLDPMFPKRSKKALVKKEMQIFQALLGPDMDSDRLFHAACRHAKERVVVKRSRSAPHLGEKKPHVSVAGRSHRFDVYLI